MVVEPNERIKARTSAEFKQGLFVAENGRDLIFTFILVSSLFLLWGVCNGMIDVMDKHFQDALNLTKSQSANVQFAHYLGYFLMAMPAGWLARRWGWKGGIIAGLLLVAAGGLWFIPATWIQEAPQVNRVSARSAFVAYLAGVCAIAAGLTLLETVANPYTTVLGPSRYAATRINLAQSCNGVGWIVGPIIGAQYFYSRNPRIEVPYVVIAVVVIGLVVIFNFSDVPDIKNEENGRLRENVPEVPPSLLRRPHFVLAIVAQCSGAALMRKARAHRILGLYGIFNVLACLLIFCNLGWISVACVFLSYFFMSIMYPTIFALGIFGLGEKTKKASAFIVMAIMGGAILPKLMGAVADKYDMCRAFIVPLICFAFVAFYGFAWPQLTKAKKTEWTGIS